MGSEKRQRQKANRNVRREQERRERQQRELRRRLTFVGGTVAVVFVALFLVYLTGRGDNGDDTGNVTAADSASDDTAGTTDTTEDDATAPLTIPPPECPAVDGSSERTTSFDTAPAMCIDPTATITAVVETNLGSFTIALDPQRAPKTVNNFVFLARYHYYDGVSFHRIIPGFVIQGGDAVGNPPGTGGPGYAFDDELPQAGEYEIGSLAMANSGPNTNGSQFFVITGDDGVGLPPSYSLFGTVTDGMDVVSAIEALPTDANDAPTEPATIISVTISES